MNRAGRDLARRTVLLVAQSERQRARLVAAGSAIVHAVETVQRSLATASEVQQICRIIGRIIRAR